MKSLASRLKLTRTNLFGSLFNKNKSTIDNNIIKELEDRFLLADVGIKTSEQIIQLLKLALKTNPNAIPLEAHIKEILLSMLKPVEKNLIIR